MSSNDITLTQITCVCHK